MSDPVSLLALFLMGLLGSTHCIGMCGGITTALGMAIPSDRRSRQMALTLLYNLGRITSYAAAGFAVALIGALGQDYLAMGPFLRGLAGLFMVALGLYIAGYWRALVRLEHLGGRVWKYLQPLGQRLLPVTTPGRALALGAVWGWLPCGLVYSALVLAMTRDSAWQGALGMVVFGSGTLPVMLLMGVASGSLLRHLQARGVRVAAGAMLVMFGLWQLLSPAVHSLAHGNQHDHGVSHGGAQIEGRVHEHH